MLHSNMDLASISFYFSTFPEKKQIYLNKELTYHKLNFSNIFFILEFWLESDPIFFRGFSQFDLMMVLYISFF